MGDLQTFFFAVYISVELWIDDASRRNWSDTGKLGKGWETLQTTCIFSIRSPFCMMVLSLLVQSVDQFLF